MTTKRLAARLATMEAHGVAGAVVLVAVRPGESLDAAAGRQCVPATLRPGTVVVFADTSAIAAIEAESVPEFHYVPAETLASAAKILATAKVPICAR